MGQLLNDAPNHASVSRSAPGLQVFADVCSTPAKLRSASIQRSTNAIAATSRFEIFTSEYLSDSRLFPVNPGQEMPSACFSRFSMFQNT